MKTQTKEKTSVVTCIVLGSWQAELQQARIIGQRAGMSARKCNQHTPSGPVEARSDLHPSRRWRTAHMQMGDDAGSGIKPCESDWPGQTRAKIRIVAVVQCRHGDELGGTVLLAPLEDLTQADVTALA